MSISLTTKEMFAFITSHDGWYKANGEIQAYCDKNTAAILKHRHKRGELGQEAYDSIASHFGFKKELLYIK